MQNSYPCAVPWPVARFDPREWAERVFLESRRSQDPSCAPKEREYADIGTQQLARVDAGLAKGHSPRASVLIFLRSPGP